MSSERKDFVIASRSSLLALCQSKLVQAQLQKSFPDYSFTIREYTTKGDRVLDVSLNKIGDKGLFTKELEQALLNKQADLAVHSLKDMPTTLPDKLILTAITVREDSSDAVVMNIRNKDLTLDTLPQGSLVGTSSLRRVAQLKRQYPHLVFKSVRGNLQTRLQKLDDYERNHFDAIILATAGLERMNLSHRITENIPKKYCYPAMGQGALAVECREDDEQIREILKVVNHAETQICCSAERAFLRKLQGGCQVPIGVLSELVDGILHLHGRVLNLDGSKCVEASHATHDFTLEGAELLGVQLAQQLCDLGANDILLEVFHI